MQALDRVTAILEAVAASRPPPTARQVADRTGLSLSTASRLLLQMADRGLVHRAARDRSYTLGPRLLAIVRAGAGAYDFTASARDVMEQVRDATGETVSLHIRRGGERVCLQVVESQEAVRRVVPVGMALPLLHTATGEVLLAGAPPAERKLYVAALGLRSQEEQALLDRLDRIRMQGWTLVVNGAIHGVVGLSAAVRHAQETVAALSVSGPADRFTRDRALHHVDTLLAAADGLAQQRGGPLP